MNSSVSRFNVAVADVVLLDLVRLQPRDDGVKGRPAARLGGPGFREQSGIRRGRVGGDGRPDAAKDGAFELALELEVVPSLDVAPRGLPREQLPHDYALDKRRFGTRPRKMPKNSKT